MKKFIFASSRAAFAGVRFPCQVLVLHCPTARKWVLLPAILASVAAGCQAEHGNYRQQAEIMGTTFSITIEGSGNHAVATRAAFQEVRRIDRLLSTYKEQSEISEVNRRAAKEPVSVGADFLRVLAASREYFELSRGAFDPSVYPLMRLWGFTKRDGRVPTDNELQEATRLVDFAKVSFDEQPHSVRFAHEGMALDFGGIAKGYAVDRAVEVLKHHGVSDAIVDAGGNFYAFGTRAGGEPWRAGVRHPLRLDEIIARLPVSDKAVATSGNYERFFEMNGTKYCHIMDPRTGMPVEGMLSVTIIADTAMAADALSTSVFVLGPDEGMRLIERLPGVEAMLIAQDPGAPEKFTILLSPGLEDHIELLLPARQ